MTEGDITIIMPNWIEGTLKVRGPYNNVKDFFVKGLNDYRYVADGSELGDYVKIPKNEWMEVVEDDDGCEIHINRDHDSLHIDGTKRAFVHDTTYIEILKEKDPLKVYTCCKVKQAWEFRVLDWVKLAKHYCVDIRIWGLERGIEFGQEIEILDGKVTLEKTLKFKDWDWEAPIPWLGG